MYTVGMMIIIWPLAIALLGLLVYVYSGKAAELGRIAFFCGFCWTTYCLVGRTVAMGSVMVALWTLVVAIAGALIYGLADDPPHTKVKEIGRIIFFCGLFWFAYSLIGHALKM